MKPRLAFGVGIGLTALVFAPFLPWKSWFPQDHRPSRLSSTTSTQSTTTVSTPENRFSGDRSQPYYLTLQEEAADAPMTWQLLVGNRVSGVAYQGEQAYDVGGEIVTSTDQLLFTAYDPSGTDIAHATATWTGQTVSVVMRRATDRDDRVVRLQDKRAAGTVVSLERQAGRWEDQKRHMGCEFELIFPTIEADGQVTREAADAMNRELRTRLLDGKTTAEQAKNAFMRECRTELEAEAESWKMMDDSGGMFQRSVAASVGIAYNQAPWLSLVIHSYSYTGGAHGLSGADTVLFDTRTGDVLELRDLFRDEAALAKYHGLVAQALLSEYGDMLFEEQANQLRAYLADRSRQLDRFRAGDMGYGTSTAFTITPRGIRMVFQQYEVAPYAVGMPTVTIPFSAWSSLASDEARRILGSR